MQRLKILVPRDVEETLRSELRQAGKREIGGVLVGEHIEDSTFRLAGLSVQRSGGSQASFVRDPAQHREFLRAFFEETGRQYGRFNYLGEWHSHPTIRALPSAVDCATMNKIVTDPDVGANFAVLLIARLHWWSGLQLSATAFLPGASPEAGCLKADPNDRPRARFKGLAISPVRRVKMI